ncbi:MAG TPA: hypothetical protein VHG31_03135, partial [Stellaceae bacterium]|nr:hypothetical protein [Stellaceae bacterium]
MQDGAAIDDPEGESPGADSPKRSRGALALDIVARWREAGPSGLVFLSASEEQAEYLGANIHSLFPDCPVMVFPRWDSLPYDPAGPSREIMGRRASVLRRLASGLERPLLIATPEAVLQRVPPRAFIKQGVKSLAPGQRVDMARLVRRLELAGYVRSGTVMEPGEYAVRG